MTSAILLNLEFAIGAKIETACSATINLKLVRNVKKASLYLIIDVYLVMEKKTIKKISSVNSAQLKQSVLGRRKLAHRALRASDFHKGNAKHAIIIRIVQDVQRLVAKNASRDSGLTPQETVNPVIQRQILSVMSANHQAQIPTYQCA